MRLRLLFASSLLLLLAFPAAADTLLTVKSHADAFQLMGETHAAKDTEIRIWAGADRLRRDDGEASFILRLDRNGFPVLQESSVSVVGTQFTTREELVSIAEGEAPAGTYEPPAGYALRPFDPMSQPGR